MEIGHFSHEHPLTLIESENNISRQGTKMKCKACQKFCSVPLYACTQCSFYLHKSCAELPTKFQNPFHLHEPLMLLFDVNRSFPCGACFKSCNGFYFHCEVCNFDLHVDCAFRMPTVEEGCKQLKHSTHMHPLVLVEKKDEVVNRVKCLACGEHCFGPCYGCDPCGVFLHQPCAEFQYPKELESFTHACPLALQTRVRPFRCRACDTCMMGICYHCERCLFYIDVECALLESIKSNDGKQIKHFNHRHPLSLTEKFGDTDQVYCYACGKGCVGPTYVCNKCKGDFSLHESCAGFAPKIYNVFHPYHPLTLLLRPTNTNQVVFKCKACCGDCSGVTYRCDLCDFNMHEECTNEVPTIKYQSDEHLLLLVEMKGTDADCNTCKESCEYGSSVLRCLRCNRNLHVWCGPLPPKIKHKHIDDLTLVESPVEDESDDESHCDEFYCDVCEEDRGTRFPIYYCEDCRYVAEVSCVISKVSSFVALSLISFFFFFWVHELLFIFE